MSNDRNVQDREVEGWAARTILVRFPLLSRARIGLAIGSLVLMAWLPITDQGRPLRPAHRVLGISLNPIVRFAYAPDAQTIATVDDFERIELRRLDGSQPTLPIDGSGHVKAMAFSPDGRLLAIGRREADVVLVEFKGSVSTRKLGIRVKETSDLAFSPDGTLLAVSSHDSPRIVLWDLPNNRERAILVGHDTPVYSVHFAPDGRSLISVASKDRQLHIWEIATNRLVCRLENIASPPHCLTYSPDGRQVATASKPRSVQIWDLTTCRATIRISGLGFPARSLAFSPDSRLLAAGSGDGSAGLWDAATGQPIRQLETGLQVLNSIAFSPDGHQIALTGNDGAIRLWSVEALLQRKVSPD